MDLYLKKHFMRKRKSLSSEWQLRFLNRLFRLLNNGYTLNEALEVIKWDKAMASTAERIIVHLKNGWPFDEALGKEQFDDSLTSYLYFSRANGNLKGSIEKAILLYKQRFKYIKKFQQTVRYPLILLVVFLILIFFIKQAVLPSFAELFFAGGHASSSISVSLFVFDLIIQCFLASVLLVIVTAILWKYIKHQLEIAQQIAIYRKIPFYRQYKQMKTSFYFATHVSSLLKTGVSMKDILHMLSAQNRLPILSHYAKQMIDELSKGMHITHLLTQLDFLDKQLSNIFQKNTDVGELQKDLTMFADFLTEELSRKIKKSITMMQPVFFIILAGFIITIYIMLMWPMFQLIKTI